MIRLIVPGIPRPKARPRIFTRGGKVMHYSPSAKDEQAFLALAAQARPVHPYTGPISVGLTFYVPAPKSMPVKLRAQVDAETLPCAKRPDLDNYAKLCLDALNGVYWQDDGQIHALSLTKLYSRTPRTELTVRDVGEGGKDA